MRDFEILKNLLQHDRSCRRFKNEIKISCDILEQLIDLTRFCASGRNIQPLKYRIVNTDEENALVYPLLQWAGYLTDWDGPIGEERPAAYLIQCIDTDIAKDCLCDDGLQLQTITLGCTALNYGTCIIKAFNAPELQKVLNIPANLIPRYVLAIGVPNEKQVIVPMDSSLPESYKYYRDADSVHYVPKRPLDELIIK